MTGKILHGAFYTKPKLWRAQLVNGMQRCGKPHPCLVEAEAHPHVEVGEHEQGQQEEHHRGQLVQWVVLQHLRHGRIIYKDTEPYMSAFLWNWPVNERCGIVFNRFYCLEIHSLSGLYFRPSLWTIAPLDEGPILVYSCLPTNLPKLNVVYRRMAVGGTGCWVVL